MMKPRNLFFILFLLLLAACAQGSKEIKPPDIRLGEDVCADCNMIISDPRFASAYVYEISAGRYQSKLFDDVGDMLAHAGKNPTHKIAAWYVHDYESKEWTDAAAASYLVSNKVETPMASGIVSFARRDRADVMAYALGVQVMDWKTLQEKFKAGEVGAGMAAMGMAGGAQPTPMAGHDHAAGGEATAQPMAGHVTMQGQEAEVEVNGYHMHLLTQEPLHAGYNVVRVHLNGPNGQAIDGAQITLQPQMNMLDSNHHSSPVENPNQEAPGMYRGAVDFSMPGGPDLGSWSLMVGFTDPSAGATGEATFDVEVAPSQLHGSFMAPGDRKIFLSVVAPMAPTVGKQPFEVFAFEKVGMMDWPPLHDLTLEIKPEMPTMGHGSPGNVNPAAQGNGHYLGAVNFTMDGPWTVTVIAKSGDQTLGQIVFSYENVTK